MSDKLATLLEQFKAELVEQLRPQMRGVVEEVLSEMLPAIQGAGESGETFSASSSDVCKAIGCSPNTLYGYIGARILDSRHFILHRSGAGKSKVGKYSFRLNATVQAIQRHSDRIVFGDGAAAAPIEFDERAEDQNRRGGAQFSNVVRLQERRA